MDFHYIFYKNQFGRRPVHIIGRFCFSEMTSALHFGTHWAISRFWGIPEEGSTKYQPVMFDMTHLFDKNVPVPGTRNWYGYASIGKVGVAACYAKCAAESNCKTFTYGASLGCRYSKCGSDPGPGACPADQQCPIATSHSVNDKYEIQACMLHSHPLGERGLTKQVDKSRTKIQRHMYTNEITTNIQQSSILLS